jgi:hypothetical protein
MKSLISGQETTVLDLNRGTAPARQDKDASEAQEAVASSKSSFIKDSGRKTLASLQNGGASGRAEFRAPKFFRS